MNAVTQYRSLRRLAHAGPMVVVVLLCWTLPAWGQTAVSVPPIGAGGGGSPGNLFSLTGPANLYVDSRGTVGYIFNLGTFETFNFRSPSTGQAWMGGQMTLGPQLSIGLVQGSNQAGSPLVFPSAPRTVSPLPPIQSSIIEEFQPLIDIP